MLRSFGRLDFWWLRRRSFRACLEPDNCLAPNDPGLAFFATGDLDGSIAEFREALRLDPEDPNARLALEKALAKKTRGQ